MRLRVLPSHPCHRTAFTLVEAVVALTITAIAASAILLGINSSLMTTIDTEEQAMAMGIAQQLLDEVLGSRYSLLSIDANGHVKDTAHDIVLKPSTAKAATGTRELFTDTDDFNGFRHQPPVDTWGVALGTEEIEGRQRHPNFMAPLGMLNRWQEEIRVYYVDEADLTKTLPDGETSDYRAIEVRVSCVDEQGGVRELVRLRQVVAYVPPIP
jgi:type II secretory pathway pseudopilin PulG